MRQFVAAALLTAALTACGAYHPPQVAPTGAQLSAGPRDSLPPVLDSIAQAPRADTVATVLSAGDLQTPSWQALFQDPVLDSLIGVAVDSNRDLRQAVARVAEYRALRGVARSDFYPQVSASGAYVKQQIALGIVPPAAYHAYRVQGEVSWEPDLWGRVRQSAAAAGADLAARQEDRRAVMLSLVGDVAEGYLQLRAYDAELAVANRTMNSRRETLRLARRRYDQGVISELDVRQFESDAAAAAARVAQFTRLATQQENRLRVLLGRQQGPIPRGLPLDQVVLAVDVPDSIPATLLENRPDVRRAERELAAASYRAAAAGAARLPSVMVLGQYGFQSPDISGLFKSNTEVYQIQGGISIPLFTGGRLRDQQAAARARVDEARWSYDQLVLSATREVNDALVAVRTARDQAAAQKIQVEALQRALHLAQERYDGGLSSYLEVLDSERSLFDAELTLAEVQQLQLASAVQLYRAVGGSWEEREKD